MDGYTARDMQDIENASSFADLLRVGFRVLKRLEQPVSMVCGPISSGGTGSIEKNLTRLHTVTDCLYKQGKIIFSQLPLENKIFKLKKEPWYQGPLQLLEELYLPLFESGLISLIYFLPDWRTSFGATWEYAQAQRLNIQIIEIEKNI